MGAYILTGDIGRHCAGSGTKEALFSALQGYDRVFRPFMEQVQESIAPATGYWTKLPTSPLGIAMLNFLLGLAAFFRSDAFAKLLDKDVKGWNLPEYEDMDRRASNKKSTHQAISNVAIPRRLLPENSFARLILGYAAAAWSALMNSNGERPSRLCACLMTVRHTFPAFNVQVV